jgi:hypothetical protein
MTDTDDELTARLRDRLDLKSFTGGADDGRTEEKTGDDHDDEDDDTEQEGPTTEAKMGDMEEAVAAIAENTDVSPDDVMDMLKPVLEGDLESEGDYGDEDDEMEQDAEGELKAENVDGLDEVVDEKLDDKVQAAVNDAFDEKLDGVATTEDLEQFASVVGDEVEQTMQKAETGVTPSPSGGGGAELTAGDVLNGGGDSE